MAQSQSQPADSQPANAVLASSLFVGLDFDVESHDDRPILRRTGTGCMAIDAALDGGIAHGKGGVCCISGDRGVGKTGLSLLFVASHLLADPTSHAAIIDTTGAFDVVRLYETILACLRKDVTIWGFRRTMKRVRQEVSANSAPALEDVVTKILERVRIMRVFDFDGVVEAIGEVKEELEEVIQESARSPSPRPTLSPAKSKAREEIADSEEEDDGLGPEEKDMLYGDASKPKAAENEGGKISMVVIDNITNVLNPLLKSNYVQAHAFLTTFLRNLTDLTHSNNLLTILLNSAIIPREIPELSTSLSEHYHQNIPNHQGSDHPSIFTSNLAYPALGKTFPYFLDVHLLLSRLFSRGGHTHTYFSSQIPGHKKNQPDMEVVNLIEVLSDRWEGRVGQWGAFRFIESKGVEVERLD